MFQLNEAVERSSLSSKYNGARGVNHGFVPHADEVEIKNQLEVTRPKTKWAKNCSM